MLSPSQIHTSGCFAPINGHKGWGSDSRLHEPNASRSTTAGAVGVGALDAVCPRPHAASRLMEMIRIETTVGRIGTSNVEGHRNMQLRRTGMKHWLIASIGVIGFATSSAAQ